MSSKKSVKPRMWLRASHGLQLLLAMAVVLVSGGLFAYHDVSVRHSRPETIRPVGHPASVRKLHSVPVTKPAVQPPAPTPQTPSAPAPVASQPAPAPPPPPSPSSSAPATSSQAVAAASASPGTTVGGLTPAPTPASTASGGAASPPASGTTSASGASSSATTLPAAAAAYSSTNWSGYFMTGQQYKAVAGSWTATAPTGNGSSTTADATWIGIGGVSTQDLIQVGTENTVSASGKVSSAVFYELLPDAPVYPNTIQIKPGDAMKASITEAAASSWTISISDTTNGQTFLVTVNYTSSHSSAEWIQEDPSYASGGLVPLDNFGKVSFTASTATFGGVSNSLSAGSAQAIKMVDGSNNNVATPSIIGSDDRSFVVTRN